MDSASTADEHASDTSSQLLDTFHDQYLQVRTTMSQQDKEITLLRAHLETSTATVTAKDTEIAQLRLRLQQASDKEQHHKDKMSQLGKDYKSARHREFDLLADVKQNEAAKRLGNVHRNTDHFIRREVERLNRELDELKERVGVTDEGL
ncbi:hypothetical protein E8E13_003163 [Curvularia kusanoi]|uniref:Uncharacterized protein n=1 Tax=Curvularia kusanoi TaxID=90978 RepID=A0A9P4W5X8_CURKU|nr:hypothetical protein E8E13_003163 [Curvularia kusanoi]